MPGHDQLFKDLFEQFLPDFLSILVPDVRARLEKTSITFLKGESFSDQPRGERKTVDLLARIEASQASPQLVLVHVEIEAEAKNLPAARMHRYYMQLCLKHSEPILPLALFLAGGKGGIQQQVHQKSVWGVDVATFRFFALGLEKAEAEVFLERQEPLAWALTALMKPTKLKRWQIKLEALRRIAQAPVNELQQFLLLNIVNTYATLRGDDARCFDAALTSETQLEVKRMQLTWADKVEARGEARGKAEGKAEGKVEGLRSSILLLLEQRFGPLPESTVSRIQALESATALQSILVQVLKIADLQALVFPEPPGTGRNGINGNGQA